MYLYIFVRTLKNVLWWIFHNIRVCVGRVFVGQRLCVWKSLFLYFSLLLSAFIIYYYIADGKKIKGKAISIYLNWIQV